MWIIRNGLILFTIVKLSEAFKADPLVVLKQGQFLMGSLENLLDGTQYLSFKGIQYAQVPERFADPVPAPWTGTHYARKHGPVCTQEGNKEGEEDCLFLNVYTPTLNHNAKLPVMVFIHGGWFVSGSGDTQEGYGPEFLLQHGVILVTFNYRLEVLGFLSLDTPEVPGNAAMKDQIAALRWVQKHIDRFGGDPNSVTLFGESAGSNSIGYHLQSWMSKGLFHKAIAQSGVSIVDCALGKNSRERAFRLAKHLGFSSFNLDDVLRFLRNVPANKLTGVTYDTMTEEEKLRDIPMQFLPVVERFEDVDENEFDDDDDDDDDNGPFIVEKPLDALVAGRMNKVPLMVGYNSGEGLIMVKGALKSLDSINANLQYLIHRELSQKISKDKQWKLGEEIRNFYVGKRNFSQDDFMPLTDMLSDKHFIQSTHRFVHFYSSLAKTYLYRFTADTELNVEKLSAGFFNVTDTSHADDLYYLFYGPKNKEAYEKNKRLKDVVFKITKIWTDFAKTGNPTPDANDVQWPSYTPSNRAYFDINDKKFSVGVNADKERMKLWDKMYCDARLPCMNY